MAERREDDLLRFIGAWRVAGPYLEQDRARRLRDMTDEECRQIISSIFTASHPPSADRPSGLNEQQRLFRKLR